MIELKIKDYCHSCGEFEAEVDKIYSGYKVVCTRVMCRNATRCARIKRYLEKEREKEKAK